VKRLIFAALVEEGVLSLKGKPIEHYSQRKDVDFGAAFLALGYFRGHIDRSPLKGQIIVYVWILDHLRKAKISDLKISIVHQYILGFDIPVHDKILVEYPISIAELFHEEPDQIFR
jgi:hypothetical protein